MRPVAAMTGRRLPAVLTLLLGLLLALVLVGCGAASAGPATDSSAGTDPESGLTYVDLADLPPEAARTVALIDSGGPFPYDKDGTVFRNDEGLLPDEPRGYYHEYTVPTPGESDRGARRIVAARDGTLYWTGDHYASFQRIRR